MGWLIIIVDIEASCPISLSNVTIKLMSTYESTTNNFKTTIYLRLERTHSWSIISNKICQKNNHKSQTLPQLSQFALGRFCTTDIQQSLLLMLCTYSCKQPSELCNNFDFEVWKTIQSIYTQTWPLRGRLLVYWKIKVLIHTDFHSTQIFVDV